MDCKEGKEFIGLYLAGDLPEEKMAQLTEHISVCPNCSEEFKQAKRYELSVKEALLLTAQKMRSPKTRILKKIEPEAKKRRRRARFISAYLLFLLIIVLLCLILAYSGLVAVSRVKIAHQRELVVGEIRLLTRAIYLYQGDYGEYPFDGNANLVLALSSTRKDRPDSLYYSFPPKRLQSGLFLDAWETPYIYTRTESGFLLYSAGPNREDDSRLRDDISP